MNRKPYSSDLTDAQWLLLPLLLPSAKSGGRPRTTDLREVVNAIFYLNREGCTWRALPHDFPPWRTVYEYFAAWKADGTWELVNGRPARWGRADRTRRLRQESTVSPAKRPRPPTAAAMTYRSGQPGLAAGGAGDEGRRGRRRRRPPGAGPVDVPAFPAAAAGASGQRLRPLRLAGLGGGAGPLPTDVGEATAGGRRFRAAAAALGGGADVRLAGPLPAAQPRLRAQDRVERGHDPDQYDSSHGPTD